MKLKRYALIPAAGLAGLAAASSPAPVPAAASATALTIYSSAGGTAHGAYSENRGVNGYALVRQEREITLAPGANSVRFTDVAALIDPTTVSFESLTDPQGTRVMEQNFQYDLVGSEKLLGKYIDRAISVEQVQGGRVERDSGTLLSTRGGMVLRHADGSVRIINTPASVTLPELPGGLITRPTLVWNLDARQAGTHRARVGYQSGGMTWWTDYNLAYSEGADANACRLDIGAWITIVNQSGAGYTDARLKLVAGDVQRVADKVLPESRMMAAAAPVAATLEQARFTEKSLFEYHLYTLQHLTTLPDNSTKQIELFPAVHGVDCAKQYVYDDGERGFYGGLDTDRGDDDISRGKIGVFLSFRNDEKNGMGMPLPAGRLRVNKLDSADGAQEFIGEDSMDHTPRDEEVRIKLGSAFDITGERRRTDFSIDVRKKVMSESFEVKLRNHKPEPVTVTVKESLFRWSNWSITEKSSGYVKRDANNLEFPLGVAADGETTLRYTVRYTW